jgi:hypothetical protein
MSINRRFFFASARLHLFDGTLRARQVEGLTAILDAWESGWADQDDRWLAYMLGTAHHETGRTMQAVRETFASTDAKAIAILDRAFAGGRLPSVTTPYWRPDAEGRSWLGRGLVQLTHKANYQRLSEATGLDLVTDPSVAMQLPVAVRIMIIGMTRGLFTGERLARSFEGAREDWRQARRIINGLERADLVAGYARRYYGCISHTT